jgi:hypothetical protein
MGNSVLKGGGQYAKTLPTVRRHTGQGVELGYTLNWRQET